jgi:hypothetical protein
MASSIKNGQATAKAASKAASRVAKRAGHGTATRAKTPIIEICESFCWGERNGNSDGIGEQTHARRAGCGEYDVTADTDMRVCFCNRSDGERFSLSLDAVYQHLIEGRMRLKNGRLPSVTHA